MKFGSMTSFSFQVLDFVFMVLLQKVNFFYWVCFLAVCYVIKIKKLIFFNCWSTQMGDCVPPLHIPSILCSPSSIFPPVATEVGQGGGGVCANAYSLHWVCRKQVSHQFVTCNSLSNSIFSVPTLKYGGTIFCLVRPCICVFDSGGSNRTAGRAGDRTFHAYCDLYHLSKLKNCLSELVQD